MVVKNVLRIMNDDVAPGSFVPRERSPRRLDRPRLESISFVDSIPCSAALTASVKDATKSFVCAKFDCKLSSADVNWK